MTLVLRRDSLTPLTYEEMDSNFEFLQSEIVDLKEGVGISPDYIRSLFQAGPGINYDATTGQIGFTGGSQVVKSINGQTGDVVISPRDYNFTTADVAEHNSRLYYTDARAWSATKDRIFAGPGLTKSESATGITFTPKTFNIALVGAITGSAQVTSLTDVVINTSLFGVDFASGNVQVTEGVVVRSPPTLSGGRRFTGLDFDPSDFLVTESGNYAMIKTRIKDNDIIEIVGNAISGTIFGELTETESGISVTFDKENGSIRVAPRDFKITLTGAVTGEGTISRLRDVTINTLNSQGFITGLDIFSDVNKVNVEKITEFQFDRDAFDIKTINKRVFVKPKNSLTPQDVRDIIGNTVQGTEQDVDLSTLTETGIIVTYDRLNNTLSVAPRNFTITIDGAVAGQATITRLRDVTLTTTNINKYISGLDAYSDSNIVNVSKITELQFNSSAFNIAASNNRLLIDTKNVLSPQDVRDIIGATVQGTERNVDLTGYTETGIIVTYDRVFNTLSVAPRDFKISLAGAVSGSVTISKLRDAIIDVQNSSNFISGLDLYSDSNQVNSSKITEVQFASTNFGVGVVGNRAYLTIKNSLSPSDVRDIIGSTITGTERNVDLNTITETGIIITYDKVFNTLSVAPRDFTIKLVGAVTGQTTISRLRDVTLDVINSNNFIAGLDFFSASNKLNSAKITEVQFSPTDFTVAVDNNRAFLSAKGALTPQDVRDIIGTTITGTERSVDLSTLTETGIIVSYDKINNTLSVAPRNFTISITGAVTGSATISKLRDATITTVNTNNYISGLDLYSDSNQNNVSKITEIQFDSAQFNLNSSGPRTTVTLKDVINQKEIKDIIGATISGTEISGNSGITETGIIVTYNSTNGTLSVAPRAFTLNFTGAMTGSATVTRLSDATINLVNSSNFISGLDTYSDVNKTNVSKITSLSFSGTDFVTSSNGAQTSISLKGALTSTDIKNIIGNTVTGTEINPSTNKASETGIIVTYNAINGTLSVAPRSFTITLEGAVTGEATITRLGDVTLTTLNSSNFISGLDTYSDVNKTNTTKITSLSFSGTDFVTSSDGSQTNISLKGALTSTDIRNIIGSTVTGTEINPSTDKVSETGIIVTYDSTNETLSIAPRTFTLTFAGAMTGNTTVTRLGDATVNLVNSSNFIQGLDVYSGATKTNTSKVTDLEFDQANFTINSINQKSVVTLKNQLTTASIKEIIGSTITGTELSADYSTLSETGIIVNYSKANGTLSIAPRSFTIKITGAITGQATVSKLNDVTINALNTNEYIAGLDVYRGAEIKNITPIKTLSFDSSQFAISTDGTKANISFASPIDAAAVRNIIGSTVLGTSRDPLTGRTSETGILVTYDSENNTVSVAPQDFTITLIGDVTGSTTISKLRSSTITTTTSAIKGLGISKNSVPFDSTVKNLNFSNNFTLTRDSETNTLGIDLANTIDTSGILSSLAGALTGSQNGILVSYNSAEKQFRYDLSNLAVSLQGAVQGSGTLSYSGTGTQTLNIVTEIGQIGSGLAVKDEGEVKGTSVTAINFVGGGVTSAVSMDGTVATVSIPNSPANEKFLLIDNGSANVPNARRLVAGTGIVLNDGGAGTDLVISASGGEVLGKVQFSQEGTLVDEVPTVNFINSQQVFFEVISDEANSRVNVTAYSLSNGWFRKDKVDNGTLTDKYGNSLDMGPIIGGIIENQINFGAIA